MCGRKYAHEELTWGDYRDMLSLVPSVPASNFQPNYNIAPTHEVPVGFADAEGAHRLALMRWGLVPHWAKDAKIGAKMINARAETLTEKPSFKPLLKAHRCAILVSGFYEWKRPENPNRAKEKQAHKIAHASGAPMIMAGLWTRNPALELTSYTVITTAASDEMAPVHHRMPAILDPGLDPGAVDRWMDGAWDDAAPLLTPHPGPLAITPISNAVGNVRNNYPELLDPLVSS
jgi:putative SOS response-associated peptidase YedK